MAVVEEVSDDDQHQPASLEQLLEHLRIPLDFARHEWETGALRFIFGVIRR